MKKLLYVLGNSFITLLVMLLIGYGWAFIEMKIMLKPNPELFGYVFKENKGNGINGIADGDIIIIKKGADYAVGDSVLYLNEKGKYLTERVTAKDQNFTTTKCDKCSKSSKAVSNNSVVGKVIGKMGVIGKVIDFLRQKFVLLGLAILGFSLVVISELMNNTTKVVKKD